MKARILGTFTWRTYNVPALRAATQEAEKWFHDYPACTMVRVEVKHNKLFGTVLVKKYNTIEAEFEELSHTTLIRRIHV